MGLRRWPLHRRVWPCRPLLWDKRLIFGRVVASLLRVVLPLFVSGAQDFVQSSLGSRRL